MNKNSNLTHSSSNSSSLANNNNNNLSISLNNPALNTQHVKKINNPLDSNASAITPSPSSNPQVLQPETNVELSASEKSLSGDNSASLAKNTLKQKLNNKNEKGIVLDESNKPKTVWSEEEVQYLMKNQKQFINYFTINEKNIISKANYYKMLIYNITSNKKIDIENELIKMENELKEAKSLFNAHIEINKINEDNTELRSFTAEEYEMIFYLKKYIKVLKAIKTVKKQN